MPANIVVVGSINMDLVVKAPRHPRPGETLIGGPFRVVPGGKGANQAVAAARMGGRVAMVGGVGRDAFGDELVSSLRHAGVDVTHVERASEATGVALITVSNSGENTIVVAPGANMAVTPEIVAAAEPAIAAADALLLQLEVSPGAVLAAAETAARHAVPVILNPAPAGPLPQGLLAHVRYLIPNEHEATLLAGQPIETADDAGEAARRLRALGAQAVAITLGSRGAIVLLPEGPQAVPPFGVDAVDTTAAGDAFLGAFAVAICEGKPLLEAVRWGSAAGALACMALGAQPSLPQRAAVERLLKEGKP